MFDGLRFGEATKTEPRKLARKAPTLPAPIAQAFDDTPIGEASGITVEGSGLDKAGTRLVSLLKKHARASGVVAFEASWEARGPEKNVIYWQKKSAK